MHTRERATILPNLSHVCYNKSVPRCAPVAQWKEQPPSKRLVGGSNPPGRTNPGIAKPRGL